MKHNGQQVFFAAIIGKERVTAWSTSRDKVLSAMNRNTRKDKGDATMVYGCDRETMDKMIRGELPKISLEKLEARKLKEIPPCSEPVSKS